MHELFENFGLDWKLIAAQVVNFFILLLVLKKFAYAPVVKMLNERQGRIKRGLEQSAESERRLVEAKLKESEIVEVAERKALGMVSRAEEIAYEKEGAILDGAHKKAEQVIASAQRTIREERERQLEEVHKDAEDLIALATARVLGKMEPDKRDDVLVKDALKELKEVAGKL